MQNNFLSYNENFHNYNNELTSYNSSWEQPNVFGETRQFDSDRVSQSNYIDNKTRSNYNYMIRQDIYNSIVEYFGDVIFTKLNSKATSDGNFYGLYYCKIGCMLCIDNRYLLVIVKDDEEIPVGTHVYLSNLNWISFQTRSIDDFDTVNSHGIKLKQQVLKNNRNTITDIEMKIIKELNDRVRYECSENYPIIVDIMKKKSKEKNIYNMMEGYENEHYTPTCSLQTLLESYQCVLTIDL